MSPKSPYVIRASELEPYSPANHSGTKNYRLIGPDVNGAKYMEIVLGDIERNEGAPPTPTPISSKPSMSWKARRLSASTASITASAPATCCSTPRGSSTPSRC
jgi:hypothetical protein